MLQFTESGKGQKGCLSLPAFITGNRLLKLKHRHVFSASGRTAVYILKPARHGFFHHTVYAGLCGDSGHGHVFLAGPDAGLHNGMHPVGNRFDLNEPALVAGRPCISGKFRHGKACMGVLVLLDSHIGNHLTLNDVLRIGYGQFIHGQAPAQFDRLSPKRTCHRQLVIPQWRGGRFKAGTNLNGRIHSDADGDGQPAAQLLRPLRHGSDMSGTWRKENGQLIPALDTEPVDSHIMGPCIRMGGIAHAQSNIWAGVIRRVGWRRNQLIQVKIRLISPVHHLLADRFPLAHHR